MSYGPINRNFPGLHRIFPEEKIRRIRGENPVSSLNAAHGSYCYQRPARMIWHLPVTITVKNWPTVFLTTPCPMTHHDITCSTSTSTIPILFLGLPLPSMPDPDGICTRGTTWAAFGYHQPNCSKWAGRSWKEGHDIVVKALAFEICLHGMGAENMDFIMSASNITKTGE